jgi:hypothetical protein
MNGKCELSDSLASSFQHVMPGKKQRQIPGLFETLAVS